MGPPRLRNKYQVTLSKALPSTPGGRKMRRRVRKSMLVIAVLGPVLGALSLSVPSAAASPAPITLALVTSLTGPSAPETSSDPAGFLARIALQNAEGGVNGHKLVPLVIDDQTSPSEIVTGVQSAISKGAFGIVSASPLFFLAAKYPQQQGVPVTGSYTDGPEWGQQPYTNMFSSDLGSVDPSYPVNTLEGKILRQFGGTVLGSYGYSISPIVVAGGGPGSQVVRVRRRQVGRSRHLGAVRQRGVHEYRSRGETAAC